MKLRRLREKDFAGIAQTDLDLGPGLNILYGPNDLGKSQDLTDPSVVRPSSAARAWSTSAVRSPTSILTLVLTP
jgi:recombinational DNA repair ATPase RecF